MTTFAQGAYTRVAYVPETTYGTTPATPTTVIIPFVNFAINATIDQFEDTSIRGDRQARTSNSGNTHVAGDFDVMLTHTNFDPFLANALTGTWATNVLKVGSTTGSFTVEQQSLDIGQYYLYTGVAVDKVALTVNTTGNIMAKFSVIGKAMSQSTTTICATPTAANNAPPFTHVGGTFKEGGSVSAIITTIALTIDNGLNANFVLGQNTNAQLSESMIKVTGTATVRLVDEVIYAKFLAGTTSSIDFTLTDGTNTYEFTMPTVKYTGATKTIKGQGTVDLDVAFTALYDTGSSSVITVTRSS